MTDSFNLPASFLVTVSHAGNEVTQTAPTDNEIMTASELTDMLKCEQSSVYNLTRKRGEARYRHRIPVIKLPCGLRFRKSSVLRWLWEQETCAA
jgi:Helix-turn-helix domain